MADGAGLLDALVALGSGATTGAVERKRENEILQLQQKEKAAKEREQRIDRALGIAGNVFQTGLIDPQVMLQMLPNIINDAAVGGTGVETLSQTQLLPSKERPPTKREVFETETRLGLLKALSKPVQPKQPSFAGVSSLFGNFDISDTRVQQQIDNALEGLPVSVSGLPPRPIQKRVTTKSSIDQINAAIDDQRTQNTGLARILDSDAFLDLQESDPQVAQDIMIQFKDGIERLKELTKLQDEKIGAQIGKEFKTGKEKKRSDLLNAIETLEKSLLGQ